MALPPTRRATTRRDSNPAPTMIEYFLRCSWARPIARSQREYVQHRRLAGMDGKANSSYSGPRGQVRFAAPSGPEEQGYLWASGGYRRGIASLFS
jgi:hypothetical protein